MMAAALKPPRPPLSTAGDRLRADGGEEVRQSPAVSEG